MISEIFGLCGSGKSLLLGYLCQRAVQDKNVNFHGLHVSTHRHYNAVFTNFACKGCYKLDFEKLGYYDYHDCLIVIDEIMLLADCRNFKNFGENLKIFFSQHRKKNIDIIYATQFHDDVDKKIRNVTNKIYYIDDMPFDVMRIRRIEPVFDVKSAHVSFSYAPASQDVFFFRKKLWRNIDSYQIINGDSYFTEPVIFSPWDSSAEVAEESEKIGGDTTTYSPRFRVSRFLNLHKRSDKNETIL